MIFNTLADLKRHAGGTVNAGVDLSALSAPYDLARERHLERYLGDELLDHLEEQARPGATPSEKEAELILLVGAALAMLTLYHWSFTSSVQHSTEGLTRTEGENVKGSWKYQTNEYRDATLASGLSKLDAALRFLDKNEADFPLWSGSDAMQYHRSVLIRDVRGLRRVHNQPADRNTYEALRPLISDVQDFVFVELLGQEQLDRLLVAMTETNAAPTPEQLAERKLTRLVQRSLAAFAVQQALYRNIVQLNGSRIVQSEILEPQGAVKQASATRTDADFSAMQNNEFAERHLSAVRNFLNQNATLFPLYQSWVETKQPDPEEKYPLTQRPASGRKILNL